MPRGRPRGSRNVLQQANRASPVARVNLSVESSPNPSPQPKRVRRWCGHSFVKYMWGGQYQNRLKNTHSFNLNNYVVEASYYKNLKSVDLTIDDTIFLCNFHFESIDEVSIERFKELCIEAEKKIMHHVCGRCGHIKLMDPTDCGSATDDHYCDDCFHGFLEHPDRKEFLTYKNDICPITQEPLTSFDRVFETKCCKTGISYDSWMAYCKSKSTRDEDYGISPIVCPVCRASNDECNDPCIFSLE